MKKILLLSCLSIFAIADFIGINPSQLQKKIDQNIVVIDIRTPPEWKELGIVPTSDTIMFFDERGNYDTNKFLSELNKKVNTKKPFALICHTGSRTSMIAPWLAKEFGYKVINLKGGMEYALKGLHLKTVPYK